MSDGFGNIDSEMPGLGPQPGNVRGAPTGLPSALAGLAKLAMQPQSRANPKFLPPPPLTETEANQPPRMTGRPASFAPVPPTKPIKADQFTPHIKTQDPRNYSEWAQPVHYDRLPQTFELPNMFGQIGAYFAQAGGQLGQAAMDVARYSGAYGDAFMKAQEYKMKMAKENLALQTALLHEHLTRALTEYKDIQAAYYEAGGRDPAKAAHATIDGVDQYNALYRKAVELDNKQLIAMFEDGQPLEVINRTLSDWDQNWRDLQAAKQKASDQSDEDAASFGLKPAAQATEPWEQPPAPRAGETAPPDPAAPAPDVRAPGVGPPPEPTDRPDTPDWAKGLPSNTATAAITMAKGLDPPYLTKPEKYHAGRYATEIGAIQNRILQDAAAGRIKPGEMQDVFRKRLGPSFASDLKGIEDYTQPGFGSGLGTGGSVRQGEYGKFLDEAAHYDMPGDAHGTGAFVATHYKEQKDFREDRTNRLILNRTNDMAYQMDNINNLMERIHNELKARGVKDTDINLASIANVLGGGTYNTLNAALNNFASAYNVVNSSGHGTLGGQRIVAEDFATWKPLSAIRDVLKTHVPSVQGILKGVHLDWESRGGKPNNMPMWNEEAEKKIDDYGKMDIVTGVLPYGKVVIHNGVPALWTGKNPIDRNAPENWVDPKSTRD